VTGRSRQAERRRFRRILKRLEAAYGPREWECGGSAVDVLVGTILSQNTSSVNSSAGFRWLKRRFGSWRAVAEADAGDIEECIRVSGLGRTKAPRIRKILRRIRATHGRITLQHLRKRSPAEACEYLMAFDGVGPKTALCVLLFAFGMAVFPVDTHIYRIARRLGALRGEVPFARAHEVLAPLIAPPDRYAMHVLLIAHGRRTCRARRPRCDDCRLLDLCPHGRRRLGAPLATK
jgi:endonuclease-3